MSTVALLALIGAAVVGLAFVAGLITLSVRRRGDRGPDIPPGMRPGPADEVLERRHLERVMAWGFVFMVVIALSVVWVWVREPDQNVDDAIVLVARAEHRGEEWFGVLNEENPLGFGCARCHGAEAEGGSVPFTNPDTGEFTQDYPVPSLTDVCGRLPVDATEAGDPDIRTTIMEGRPGTPMPSWSVRFAGPMNDQQITDLITYLVSIQTVPDEENLCTNPAAATAEEEPAAGPSPDVTPGAPAEEEPAEEQNSPAPETEQS